MSQSSLRMPRSVPLLTNRAVAATVEQLELLARINSSWDKPIILDAEWFYPWDRGWLIRTGEAWFERVDRVAKKLFPLADIYWWSGQYPERWPKWASLAVPMYHAADAKQPNTRPIRNAVNRCGVLPLIQTVYVHGEGKLLPLDLFAEQAQILKDMGYRRIGVFAGSQTKRYDEMIEYARRSTR